MITNNNKEKIKRNLSLGILYAFVIGQIFPMVWLINFSLCKTGDLFVSGIFKLPSPPQFQNYVAAWVDGKVPKYFFNSFLIAAITIVLTIVLSLTLGYAFTRMNWKLRGLFMTIMLMGMMIPIHATLLPNFITFNAIGGLLDTYQGLIIPYTAFALPTGIFVMSGFLETVPKSLEESAIIDGCGIYGIIFRVILPITKPAVVTITVMTFLSCWNEYVMAATYLNSDNLRTLPFSVMNFVGQYSSDYAKQFAVMALTAVPAILFYVFLNEHITKGVTMGAVKG